MDNVTFIEVENSDGSKTTHAIIDRGNGEFTSMPKEVYDAQRDQQSATAGLPLNINSTIAAQQNGMVKP